jgi:electron transfer flavoprotein alpha subunit
LPAAVGIEPGLLLREFTTRDYLANLSRNVELIRWPKKVEQRPVKLAMGSQLSDSGIALPDGPAGILTPNQAATCFLKEIGQGEMSSDHGSFNGPFMEVVNPTNLEGRPSGDLTKGSRVVGVVAVDDMGRLHPSAIATLHAVQLLAAAWRAEPVMMLLVPPAEDVQRVAVAQCIGSYQGDMVLVATPAATLAGVVREQLLIDCWPEMSNPPKAIVGETWTETALATLAARAAKPGPIASRIRKIEIDQGHVVLIASRARGKLLTRQVLDSKPAATMWISLAAEAEIRAGREPLAGRPINVQRWTPRLERFFGKSEIQRLLDEVKEEIGVARLADAEFIVDVGFGVGNRDGYETVIEPLERALCRLGVRSLVIGGSRKVTEELHLLPADRQIGQSGVSVNPRLILAVGISGAPQHLNYIGPRATILAFNRDAEAPIMTLNQRQPRPRVFPVVGDLFETVPAFIAALGKEEG